MTTAQTLGVDFASFTPASAASAKTASAVSEDRFLTLLVTQLKNQDPLNPMDNAQMTTQLAQISTVGGIDKLNATLQSLVSAYGATQSMQATSMIGQGVLVPGSALTLQNGAGTAGISLAEPADRVVVSITDSAGVLRKQIELGAQPAGNTTFRWDGATENGRAADGRYGFTVTAMRGENKIASTPLAYGRVTAVSPAPTGATVTVGDLGTVAFSDVKQVLQ